ncbi:MAG TPA: cytidylate kinase-like family protein [Gemmataceae bacterium]|nr:cytidylate kinase-like family protein [Gemmataceae bacterium]
MVHDFSRVASTEALVRANEHWQSRHLEEASAGAGSPTKFTIAFSREAGTYGAAIARAVGNRLGWPVYDSELLQRIAEDMGVHRALLESVDEKRASWLSECLESFSSAPAVSEFAYSRRLVETLLSLAAHGDCVIVGRGAAKVLPAATTLRVRIVAPLEYRVEAVSREHGIAREQAAKQVEATDRERRRFMEEHFRLDPTDPANYDLILNAARLSHAECADIVIAALDRLRARPVGSSPSPAAKIQQAG